MLFYIGGTLVLLSLSHQSALGVDKGSWVLWFDTGKYWLHLCQVMTSTHSFQFKPVAEQILSLYFETRT